MTRRACAAVLAAALLGGTAEAASNCVARKNSVAELICGDPEMAAADTAMTAAYEAALPIMAADQQALLRDDQTAWLAERETECAPDRTGDIKQCAWEMTARRADYLTARPLSGPGPTARLLPYLVKHPHSTTACEARVAVYDFGPAPATGGTRAFGEAVHALIERLDGADLARDPDLDSDGDCTFNIGADVTYAAPGLVAVGMPIYLADGSAHGLIDQRGIVADLDAGRTLAFADIFPETAKPELIAACTADLKAAKLAVYADLGSDSEIVAGVDAELARHAAVIAERVGDLSRWIVWADRTEVYFPPQALGANVEGAYLCRLGNELLAKAAGAGGWIVK